MSIIKNGKEMGRAWLTDGHGHDIDVEGRSLGLKVIEIDHGKIHDELAYFHSSFIELPSSESRQFVFIAPNTTKRIHLVWEIDVESESSITLTEEIATDADGTSITSFNRDRNSANTTDLVLTHTPINPTGGIVLVSKRKGEGRKIGGISRDAFEIILKQNTKYLIDITNLSTGNSLTNWLFNWYEEV